MRILLLAHSFNSLTQRLWTELGERGYELSLELDVNDAVTTDAVRRFAPDVVLAPFLKRAIPERVWRAVRCLVVHPGVPGDRGPSALDWAVQDGESHWGVTVLQANAEMDGGDIWASAEFAMRPASKGSLYRNEVTEAAVTAVLQALESIEAGVAPTPLAQFAGARGRLRPLLRQELRQIDWSHETTASVLRKLRAADGVPGVLDRILGFDVYCYDAHPERLMRGTRGTVIAQRQQAICRATVDGAVWITHLKDAADTERPFKLPAAMVLGARLDGVPEVDAPAQPAALTWNDIRYEEHGPVGVLHFPFYNGAMSTRQCQRLHAAYRTACERPTRIIVLAGGRDFWSNGLHLNVIEASDNPAEESWRNINAMDDLALALLQTDSHLTVAALQGNAGAGGVFLALAADDVVARDGTVLNPHYKGMGNLYGSEYWTYVLPRRLGPERARQITEGRLPLSARSASRLGLIDGCYGATPADFMQQTLDRAHTLAGTGFAARLAAKRERRIADEAAKPLAAYRAEELNRMRLNFFGFDSSYHVARYNFVRKTSKARTPSYLARHRTPTSPLSHAPSP